jgi:hypothetical protein
MLLALPSWRWVLLFVVLAGLVSAVLLLFIKPKAVLLLFTEYMFRSRWAVGVLLFASILCIGAGVFLKSTAGNALLVAGILIGCSAYVPYLYFSAQGMCQTKGKSWMLTVAMSVFPFWGFLYYDPDQQIEEDRDARADMEVHRQLLRRESRLKFQALAILINPDSLSWSSS